MNPELLLFHDRIVKCTRPEDLFGPLAGKLPAQLKALRSLFRRFAAISHVDKYLRLDEKRIAHVAFSRLNDLHREAELLLHGGKYGTGARAAKRPSTPPSMRTPKGIYTISSGLTSGDLSSVYLGEFDGRVPIIAKIASSSSFNDLLKVESTILSHLNEAAKPTTAYRQFVPTLLDTFRIRIDDPSSDSRHVNIFSRVDGLHPLSDIVSQYPAGIDGRHFVWIFNRLLSTLSFIHSQGLVHGSVLPPHVLIHPTTHGIQLIDYCFSVPAGHRLVAYSKPYSAYYAPELLERLPASPSSDIYMAAMCMSYILGADFGLYFPPTVPPKFARLLQTCLFKNPARRPSDAWTLLEEVLSIAKEVYGPKKYIPLEMV